MKFVTSIIATAGLTFVATISALNFALASAIGPKQQPA
jgi:hypothetical protein